MGFHYFGNRRGDICPICEGQRGKPDCRLSDRNIYFCRGEEAHDGRYRYVGTDTNGFSMYVLADGENRLQSEARRQDFLAQKSKLAAERKAKLSKLPNLKERDHQFRRLAQHAGLGSHHRQHLKDKRELTDTQIDAAIERGLFWTWQDDSDLPLLPLNLPGVDPSTGKLRQYFKGMAIAVPNARGEITGVQIRPNVGGQYYWVSSDSKKIPIRGSGPQLPNGELPIAVHCKPSTTIGLVDSVSLKPFLASERLGTTFIGAAGSNFASSPEALREALEALQPEQIIFYPDAGDSSNPHVNKSIEKTVELLQHWGLPLKIAWWGQHDYDHDQDIDELPLDQLHRIELLTPESYLKMTEAILEDQWQHQYQQQALKSWKKSRQFIPTRIIHEQWLNLDPSELKESGIYAIRSAMGTGKTQWLEEFFKSSEQGAVAIGYRNSLLLQSCERWPNFYHLHSDSAFDLVRDPHSRIACCLDSLNRFQDRDFDGKVLILDESLSVILHGLMSGTLTGKRDQCLAKLQAAIARAAIVIPMDGGNTDVVVDYLAKLRGDGPVTKILNTYQRRQLHIELLGDTINANGKAIDDRSPLLKLAIATLENIDINPDETARSIVIFSDSQRQCEIAESMLETRGYSTLRVDSKTATSKEVKSFLKDPDAYLEATQPRVLIYSPTAESGLNVGIKDFFYKGFGLFFGVIPIASMCQMMQRVRDIGEISLWCRRYAFKDDEGNRSVFPRRLQQWLSDYIQADALACLKGSSREETAKEWVQQLLKTYDDPHLSTHNILAAAINYERQHTRDCLKMALQDAGHHVTVIEQPVAEGLREEASEIREQILTSDANAIFHAKDITLSAAIRIKSRWSSSLAERWSCEKALLKARLPGIEYQSCWGPEFILQVLFKERSLIQSLERWWLLNHMDAAQERSLQRWETLIEQGQIPFLPDIRSDFALLKAMQEVGIPELFEQSEALNGESNLVKQLLLKCKHRQTALALRRTVGKQKPLEFLGRLIRLIGGTTQAEQHWNRDEHRGKRRYHFISPDQASEMHQSILDCIGTRFQKYCLQSAERESQKAVEVATPSSNNFKFLGQGVANQTSVIPLTAQFSIGDIVKRTCDGSRFLIQKFAGQYAWVKWLDQYVPLVSVPMPLTDFVPENQYQALSPLEFKQQIQLPQAN